MVRTFSRQTIDRIMAAVRWVEDRMRNPEPRRGRWQGKPHIPIRQVRWAKLDGRLSKGGTATASAWQTTGGGWEGWDEDSTENETVTCPPTCSGLPGPADVDTANGIFVQIELINGVWFVVQPHVIEIIGQATGAVATSDPTFTIDNVTTISGPPVVDSPGDTITIQNTHDWQIDNNGVVQAVWNGDDEQWEAVQATCPA